MPDLTAEQAATTVVQTLRDSGHIAYFAGGCVRDRLLGLPAKDYDVATDARPERVQGLFRKTQAVGAAFGVILVRLGGQMIEVATFRSDGNYEDGRRPATVTFDTAEADAQRRDFTINGLFYDPFDQKIIDYVGGQADLASKTLRAIGNPAERFAEDHLRLLRAVRFAARFGLTIELETATAMDAAAPRLGKISAERIADELRRILTAPSRNEAYQLLLRHRLIASIFPEFDVRQVNPYWSLFFHLAPGRPIAFPLALVAMMLDFWRHRHPVSQRRDMFGSLDAGDAKRIARLWRERLKLSNEEADACNDIGRWTFAVFGKTTPDNALLKRLLANPWATQIRQLLDVMRSIEVSDDTDALRLRLDALAQTEIAPPPLLNGDQLIAAGVSPGPSFKRVLDAVYDAQLNGTIHSESEALRLGLALIQEGAKR